MLFTMIIYNKYPRLSTLNNNIIKYIYGKWRGTCTHIQIYCDVHTCFILTMIYNTVYIIYNCNVINND